MVYVLAVFVILVLYDLPRFIRNKEQPKLFVIYAFMMTVSLAVSLLIAAGKRPPAPSHWIEGLFKMIGVVK